MEWNDMQSENYTEMKYNENRSSIFKYCLNELYDGPRKISNKHLKIARELSDSLQRIFNNCIKTASKGRFFHCTLISH